MSVTCDDCGKTVRRAGRTRCRECAARRFKREADAILRPVPARAPSLHRHTVQGWFMDFHPAAARARWAGVK